MAILNSIIAAKQGNPTFGNRADGLKVSGDLHYALAEYVASGSEAINDVIRLVQLPDRAIVIPQLCSIRHEAMGTAFSVKIGDEDTTIDDDRYSAALDIKAVGQTAFSTAAVGGLTPHALTKQDGAWITATVTAATTVTEGKKMLVLIGYLVQV